MTSTFTRSTRCPFTFLTSVIKLRIFHQLALFRLLPSHTFAVAFQSSSLCFTDLIAKTAPQQSRLCEAVICFREQILEISAQDTDTSSAQRCTATCSIYFFIIARTASRKYVPLPTVPRWLSSPCALDCRTTPAASCHLYRIFSSRVPRCHTSKTRDLSGHE